MFLVKNKSRKILNTLKYGLTNQNSRTTYVTNCRMTSQARGAITDSNNVMYVHATVHLEKKPSDVTTRLVRTRKRLIQNSVLTHSCLGTNRGERGRGHDDVINDNIMTSQHCCLIVRSMLRCIASFADHQGEGRRVASATSGAEERVTSHVSWQEVEEEKWPRERRVTDLKSTTTRHS